MLSNKIIFYLHTQLFQGKYGSWNNENSSFGRRFRDTTRMPRGPTSRRGRSVELTISGHRQRSHHKKPLGFLARQAFFLHKISTILTNNKKNHKCFPRNSRGKRQQKLLKKKNNYNTRKKKWKAKQKHVKQTWRKYKFWARINVTQNNLFTFINWKYVFDGFFLKPNLFLFL